MFRLYKLKDYNFRLVVYLIVLSIIGVLLVGSADPSLRSRQIAGLVAGIVIMIFLSLIDYSWILQFYWIIYVVNIGLLTLVMLFGMTVKGAARWVVIGGIQLQPTELSKVLLIMFLAMYFMKNSESLNKFTTMLKVLVLVAFPLFLIFRQPDLKNTITMTAVFICMYFAAGLNYKTIGLALLIIIPLAVGGLLLITKTDLPIIDDYQKERIMTFLNSDEDEYSEDAMQQENSIMAIGSGGLTGKGLGSENEKSVSKGDFIAEIQNDFIFAVAGEELGFVGCAVIVLLEFLIVFECLRTGKRAKDLSGRLFCTGIGSLIGIQSFINIGVATGVLPNTGTTLPFVSYGLTSLISLYIGMGLVLNVSLQHRVTYEGGPLNGRYAIRTETR
ncbi:MAG: rod shape-determining protein RodA [Eubacterium sp.]|nr:rod shape-determining protein RodA [Eubacterium sp.]